MRRLVLLALVSLPLSGPASVRSEQPSGAAFLDQVEVRVVDVDVVVLDGDGQRVFGLEREDFEILEDGQPVEITNFAAYVATPPSPESAGAEAAASSEARRPPALSWAFYVDQSRLDPGPRNAVLEDLVEFASRSVRAGDRALAATYDGHALKFLAPLGAAPATVEALAAARETLGSPVVESSRRHFLQNQINAVNLADRDAPILAQELLVEVDAVADAEAERDRWSMAAFHDLLAVLSGIEGRIAIVLVSGGFDPQPGESLYRAWQAKFGVIGLAAPGGRELDRRGREAARDFERLLAAAGRGRFTVYSIQAGQRRGPDVSAETPNVAGLVGPSANVDASDLIQGSAVAAFSTETGGRSFAFGGDMASRLEAARGDLDSYYSLGYRPIGLRDQRRKIDVRVRRSGLRAVHRRAVSEATWRERTGDLAVTALLADPAPDPTFGAEIVIGAPVEKRGLRRSRLVPVTVNVPLRGTTLLPEGEHHRGRFYFQLALREPDGGYRRLEARPLEFQVPNAQLATALGQHVAFRMELEVAPGEYRVAAGILDELGGLVGVATAPLTLPASR